MLLHFYPRNSMWSCILILRMDILMEYFAKFLPANLLYRGCKSLFGAESYAMDILL